MLSEKSRSSLFQNLSPVVGEDAVAEMLAHFPATEGERPVAKEHLDARVGELRTEIAEVRVEIAEVRVEVTEVRVEVGELRGEIKAMGGELRGDMKALGAELRAELHSETKRLMLWLPGSIAAICAAIAFITRLTL